MAVACIILLLSLFAGLWRAARGPEIADRLIGLQMTGTTGIALLLLVAEWQQQPAIRDVALVLALLGAALAIALVQIVRSTERKT